MILDDGVCTIFRKKDISEPGGKPVFKYLPIWASWFGFLAWETSPTDGVAGRQMNRVDARIRIHQYTQIRQYDVVVLDKIASFDERAKDADVYQITRAYHGKDDDSPTLISDLSLVVMQT